MSGDKREKARQEALKHMHRHETDKSPDYYLQGILKGDRGILAQALTLIEGSLPTQREQAGALLDACLPHRRNSFRIGITGVPGVGKSTFIETFGKLLTSQGHKVAILAIDPSSPVSGGSILGDKTRMAHLATDPNAFIRPTAAADVLGGVARATRESIILCESAGYDVILIETVGVGQSETAVYDMTDMFLLLMLAGAGDQLQGIKRGIMEMADMVLITKADSGNEKNAVRARAEYHSALHLFPPKPHGKEVLVRTISSLENIGISETWTDIQAWFRWMDERGVRESRRKHQDLQWMKESIAHLLNNWLMNSEKGRLEVARAEEDVRSGKISPFRAAEKIIKQLSPGL
jgi:LAO/AO transport system kinase